jgi:hypothetical protein
MKYIRFSEVYIAYHNRSTEYMDIKFSQNADVA